MDSLPASMETSYASPHRAIKTEEDCLSDIYNVSDRGYLKKTFGTIPRYRSKSTAQLSTPMTSRSTSISGDHELIAEDDFIKNENDESYIGKGNSLHNRSTPPASSPERGASPSGRRKSVPYMTQQNPRNISPSPSTSQESVGSSIFVDESSTNAGKSTSNKDDKMTSFDFEPKVEAVQRQTTRGRIQHPERRAPRPERKPRPGSPPILPPVKNRKPSVHTSTTSIPIVSRLAKISTPDRPIKIGGNSQNHTPGDLGAQEDLPRSRSLKSISLCPTFASSFGSDDDIPTSEEMVQEAAKTITDSTNRFMVDRLLRAWPSVRTLQISSSIHDDPSTSVSDDSRDIYTDYGSDYHPQLTSGRLQNFGKDTRNNLKFVETQQDFLGLSKQAMEIEKQIPQSSSRPLPSLPRVPGMFKALYHDAERNSLEYLEFSEDEEISDRDDGHYRSGSIVRSHKSGGPEVPGGDRSLKRGRTESVDWCPAPFVDDDMPSDEEIAEIGKEDFERSVSNKPKRQKVVGDRIGKNEGTISREPKEAVDGAQDTLFAQMGECPMVAVPNDEIGSK